MNRLLCAVAALSCAVSALGQGARYESRVVTVSSNVPYGANAPLLAIPRAKVTICNDGACSVVTPVYSNQGLTNRASNPMTTDTQGAFAFWIAGGTYFRKVQNQNGTVLGTYPFTVGGTGSGSGTVTIVSGINTNGFTVGVSSPSTTPAITVGVDGSHYLPTTTDRDGWNAKQAALTLTTSGTSGAASLTGSTLNIPNYSVGGGGNVSTGATLTNGHCITGAGGSAIGVDPNCSLSSGSLDTTLFSASGALTGAPIAARSYMTYYAPSHLMQMLAVGPNTGTVGSVQFLGTNSDVSTIDPYFGCTDGTACAFNVPLSGVGTGLTALNGSNISSGTVSASRLPTFGTAAAGIVPSSGGGTTNFLRADGAWAAPPGGSGITGLTTGYIPQATSSTTIGNGFIDYGLTTAGVYTSTKELDLPAIALTGSGPFTIDGDAGSAPSGIGGDGLIWFDTSNRWKMNPNNTGALNFVGIATAGTSGHLAVLASNGIDILDGGAVPAAGTTISGATNQVVRMTGASTAAGDTTFTSTGAGVQTFSTAVTAAQSTITEGNTANTNGHVHTINCNTSQSGNPLGVNNQFGTAFYVGCDGRLNLGSLIAFNGISTFADSQIPIITAGSSHAAAAVTNGTTNVTLIASAIAGSYEVCGTLTVAAVGTAGTIALSMTYNNGASQTLTGTPATVLTTTAGNSVTIPCQVIRLAATTALTYTVTGAALTGSPTIFRDVHVKVLSQP